MVMSWTYGLFLGMRCRWGGNVGRAAVEFGLGFAAWALGLRRVNGGR